MRPVTITVTGNGASPLNSSPVPIDRYLNPVNIGLTFKTSGNTTAFKVQYTNDDPWGTYATDFNTNATWFDHASMTAMTAVAAGTITTPVTAVRLQANASGTDTGTLIINQSGGPGN